LRKLRKLDEKLAEVNTCARREQPGQQMTDQNAPAKVTLRDFSQAAGVSVSTALRGLCGAAGISSKVRA
jgi:hypothetical protein